ncbi:hypothetical protein [Marispirochaeta aestuarii]|uniref:hypothetical protein n=1 Tax=Marispirochaeta aestuarii TaxID=1963862 RepID=UPI0029C6E110|nr:hypothetical protein [Marispirochaeta aestuarii]
MSKRVTLSIPDALYRKLEEWRDSFNLSRVFQDALAEMIRRKESLMERFHDDLPQIIARLRQEKREAEGSWEKLGHDRGLLWARSAHWLDLKKTLSCDAHTLLGDTSPFSDAFWKSLEEETAGIDREDRADFTGTFAEGWLAGVREFWTMVEDKL